MKIIISKSELLSTLLSASRFNQGKLITSTALQGLYLQAKGKDLLVRSTNLNEFYESRLQTQVDEEGVALIEGRSLVEFISNLSEGFITLNKVGKVLQVIQNKTEGDFPLMAQEEYVEFPTLTPKEIPLSEGIIANLNQIVFATSKDEGRPALTGVRLTKFGDSHCLVATDGFRMSLYRFDYEKNLEPVTFSSNFISEFLKMSQKFIQKEKIILELDDKNDLVRFTHESETIISRLIAGEFPPFEKVIPTERALRVRVDREEFLRGIKLIGVFAREMNNVICLDFSAKGLTISPKSTITKTSTAHVDLEKFDGEARVLAFNYKYLQEFLGQTKEKTIQIDMNEKTSPVLFTFDNNENFLHIIMPLRTE